MPIRWYGPANPEDPTYRHFERIVNLCLHGGVFAAVNSGSWFLQEMRHPFPEGSLTWVTSLWASLIRPLNQLFEQEQIQSIILWAHAKWGMMKCQLWMIGFVSKG